MPWRCINAGIVNTFEFKTNIDILIGSLFDHYCIYYWQLCQLVILLLTVGYTKYPIKLFLPVCLPHKRHLSPPMCLASPDLLLCE